jgi:hypothetical protein
MLNIISVCFISNLLSFLNTFKAFNQLITLIFCDDFLRSAYDYNILIINTNSDWEATRNSCKWQRKEIKVRSHERTSTLRYVELP